MTFSRGFFLTFCLLVVVANIACAQQQRSSRSTEYWKKTKPVNSRSVFRKIQTSDVETTPGDKLQEEDTDSVEKLIEESERNRDRYDELDSSDPSDEASEEEDDLPRTRQGFSWPEMSLSQINIDPRISYEKTPTDRSYMLSQGFGRSWDQVSAVVKDYRWESAGIKYQPLYFEDVALERYGQCRSGFIQAIVSTSHFFKSAALLPFHMHQDPPYSCEYPLGYCRVGNCAPKTRQKFRWR